MQATGNDTSFDTAQVAGAIVLLALVGLVLLNRATVNINFAAKVGS
jgi:hypothetical protein